MSATTDSKQPLIRFTDVSLGYGDFTVLKNINLEAKRGQVIAMMGGSGSGKTTLLRGATAQIFAQAGKIEVFDKDLGQCSPREIEQLRKRMGVLFQQGALFTDLNVFDNVAFPLREHLKISDAEIARIVLEKLDAVGLRAAAHLKISEISGGMARRVALARAIVLEPELIFYDEPFAGLDPISLGITAQLIRDLSDELNCASIIITHDVPESFKIADYVYLVGLGKMITHGTPEELESTEDEYVQQFLNGTPDGPIAFHYPTTPAFEAWLEKNSKHS
ncbi:MAG TPA: ABC transporter ATP-binding protein [Paenalcaligenes sp.]|nr:ABC transporter ATP-binding protein [Paenalcaligenes sp.]